MSSLGAASAGTRRVVNLSGQRRRFTGVRRVYRRPWTFKEKVRSIAMQETGIHTKQRVFSGALNFQAGQRILKPMECMTSAFYTNLTVLSSGTREQAKIRSASTTYVFSNGNNFPLRITTYEVYCRKNCVNKIEDQLADQSVAQTIPMIDPTVGTSFRRYFKILKRSHMFLQAGQQVELTCRQFYRSPKTITGDVEANTAYVYPLGSKALLCYFEGVPSEDTSATQTVNLPFGKVNFAGYDKCTYYYEEENDPDVGVTNQLPIVTAGQTFRIYTDVALITEATDGP